MDSLVQQINLYTPPDKRLRLTLSTLMLTFVVGLVSILALAMYVEYQITALDQATATAKTQFQQLKDQLALQRAKLEVGEDPYLIAELERLRSDRRSIEVLLSVIQSHTQAADARYSDYMRGLARHPVNGLWIERLHVADADGVLVLTGNVRAPALVPKLLERLSQERVFDGVTFSDVVFDRFEEDQDTSTLRFELKTREAMEADNAG